MTDTLKLRLAITASGHSRKECADALGVSLYTFHRKLHNETEFKASEIAILCSFLNINDKEEIFFAK